ncbi:MAG: hypothetical protein ABI867_07140 [Kofleriaceae bacterium]
MRKPGGSRDEIKRLRLPRPIAARRVRVILLGARTLELPAVVPVRTSSLASGRENPELWIPPAQLRSIRSSRGNA